MKKKVLVGLLAHELAHFSIYEKISILKFYGIYFKALTNKKFLRKYVVMDERRTDKLVIKKGYGKELLATKIEAKRICEGTKYEKRLNNYLSVKEVQKILKRDKKTQ